MDFDEMASMTEEQKKALIRSIIGTQGMPVPPGPGLDPSGKKLNEAPVRGPMLAGGSLHDAITASWPEPGSKYPAGTAISPNTPLPEWQSPGVEGFRGPTGFALPQPTPAAPTPPVHSTGAGGLEGRIKGEPEANPFVAPRGTNIPDMSDLFHKAVARVTQPSPTIPNAPSSPVDPYVEQALGFALPLGRGVGALGAIGKAAVRGGADAAFSPGNWATMARSGMNRFFRGSKGYTNVADDAVPLARQSTPLGMSPSTPTPSGVDFRGIHNEVRRNMRSPTREIAPYSPAEKARVQEAVRGRNAYARSLQKSQQPTYNAAEKARVRDAALKNRRDMRLIDQLEEKGRLDAGTGRYNYLVRR